MISVMLAIVIFSHLPIAELSAMNWDHWWTYDGISGSAFWGVINPDWKMCGKGKRQSPINLSTDKFIFNGDLIQVSIDQERVNGELQNTGHTIKFTIDNTNNRWPINITGGPLSYRYQFHELHLHFGLKNEQGSEHAVDGIHYAGEIQLYGYNSNLYNTYEEALESPNGIVGIASIIKVGQQSNPELRYFTDQVLKVPKRGDKRQLRHLAVASLVAQTKQYVTYEGSFTFPGCQESVTWIISNTAIRIAPQHLNALRKVMESRTSSKNVALLADNFREIQPLNNRVLFTNIQSSVGDKSTIKKCSEITGFKEKMIFYTINVQNGGQSSKWIKNEP